jgi:hypothetical protein
MKHATSTVHAFNTKLLSHLKVVLPKVNKIVYFSDGAASQYKNYKNLVNLCHHEKDHGLTAQWNFFATSHGKSPCDGIGGTVKRLVARASLQATVTDQILTAKQMFDWAYQHITGITFFYVSDDDVNANTQRFQLEERYASSKTISGTRSHHSFVPISMHKMEMRRLSTDNLYKTVLMSDHTESDPNTMDPADVHEAVDLSVALPDDYQPGKYIACVYDRDWYVGTIDERSDENNDVHVKFMNRSKRSGALSWPTDDSRNECYIPVQDIICTISAPEMQGHGGRQYKLSSLDYDRIMALLPKFIKE